MKRIALLLLLPVLFGALAACGGDDDSSDDATNGDTGDPAGDTNGDNGESGAEDNGDGGDTDAGDGGGAADNPTPSPDVFDMEAATEGEDGLLYIDETEGDGATAESDSNVVVHYTGMLTDGSEFESTEDVGDPAAFNLNEVIPGFAQGIEGMSEGGVRTVYIPSGLAYGDQGSGPIPPGADLIFRIELEEVAEVGADGIDGDDVDDGEGDDSGSSGEED